jgi:hypothetical protein
MDSMRAAWDPYKYFSINVCKLFVKLSHEYSNFSEALTG